MNQYYKLTLSGFFAYIGLDSQESGEKAKWERGGKDHKLGFEPLCVETVLMRL